MSLANFIEAEDPRRLDVKPSGSGVLGDLLERYVRQREAGSSKRKTRKESQIDRPSRGYVFPSIWKLFGRQANQFHCEACLLYPLPG